MTITAYFYELTLHSVCNIITLYNVCSVHLRMFSTSGVFSTSGDTMSTLGGYHEYIRGVQYIGDLMSTLEDVQYIGGIPLVHRGMFSTFGGTMSTSEGYHEYIGGI